MRDINEAILALNEAIEIDAEAVNKVFLNRVPLNNELADYPTLPVLQERDGTCSVGALGFINMIMTELDLPKICSLHNEENVIVGFDVFCPEVDAVEECDGMCSEVECTHVTVGDKRIKGFPHVMQCTECGGIMDIILVVNGVAAYFCNECMYMEVG